MIVDTSALVAVIKREPHFLELVDAVSAGFGILPAPVVVEFHRVTSGHGNRPDPAAVRLITRLQADEFSIVPFTAQDAFAAVELNIEHGTGNGGGGRLNMLDLMVFAMARRLDLPILCTGRDFHEAGAKLHPASRIDER